MKKIIATTFAALLLLAVGAKQTDPSKAVRATNSTTAVKQLPVATRVETNKPATTTYADKQKRADERAKATASIKAYNANEHNSHYTTKENAAKPVIETKTPSPVVHSASYEKRADERAGHNTPKDWGKMKSPMAGKK